MSKHTKGPWEFGKSGSKYQRIDAPNADIPWFSLAKVVVRMDGSLCAEGLHNARLIAESPELLQLVIELLAEYEGDAYHKSEELVNRAYAAIERVTGGPQA